MHILKKSISFSLLIAFTCGFSTISVQAGEIPTRGPIPFSAFDIDENGVISEDEFNSVRDDRMATRTAEGRPLRGSATAPSFSEFDANGDGQLSQKELETGQQAHRKERRGMDMDQDARKSQGMGRNMPFFSDFDLNGDGRVIEDEFNEARSKRITERSQQGYKMRYLGSAPSFADIDANGDGELSADEYAEHQYQSQQPR